MKHRFLSTVAVTVFAAAVACGAAALAGNGQGQNDQGHNDQGHNGQGNNGQGRGQGTLTPIKHLVVIFDENRSFDHYFGTYPNAGNPVGELPFTAKRGTPKVNNYEANPKLLTNNPNFLNTANGAGAANPFRLDRTQANTADQNHAYTPEQQAYDNGKADLFPEFTGSATAGAAGTFGTKGQVMGYFDGNTVTALWNYAQNFAMNDNAYTDTYGPSTPGAIEVVSGQTNGVVSGTAGATPSSSVPDTQGGFTLIGDADPAGDTCSGSGAISLTSKNIGDLLNAADISWGGFAGGFNLQTVNANGTTGCARSTFSSVLNASPNDYVPHHIWFQYYASTANPTHARPSSVQAIGHTTANGAKDPANHQYDIEDFFAAVSAGNFPAVSYIKPPSVQDAHPGNSDPLDEQQGIVDVVNFLQQQPEWDETAVIITYDDSDGWYDHAFATPTSASFDPTADQLNGPGVCGTQNKVPDGLDGKPVNGRCGPGTRVPFVVISPFAKQNYVGHNRVSQASVVRFIEDNWLHGERLGGGSFDESAGSIIDLFDFGGHAGKLFLDPTVGTVTIGPSEHGHH